MIELPDGPFLGRAKVETLRKDIAELRDACRAEGTPRIQRAIDRAERWLGLVIAKTGDTT